MKIMVFRCNGLNGSLSKVLDFGVVMHMLETCCGANSVKPYPFHNLRSSIYIDPKAHESFRTLHAVIMFNGKGVQKAVSRPHTCQHRRILDPPIAYHIPPTPPKSSFSSCLPTNCRLYIPS